MSWWQKLVNKARGVRGAGDENASGGCDHGAIHLRQGTAEFEWFVARGELEMGRDLRHGAGHLGSLLAYDPANPEWVDLLHKYLEAAGPDPESLIPRGKELYASTEAVRAYIWNKQGRLAEAVELLADVVHAKADARYLEAWGLDWLEPPGAVESLPPPLALRLFGSTLGRFPEARLAPLPRLRQVQRWARLSERFAQAHPQDNPALMVRAGLLRKAGRFDDAEAAARTALDRDPDWHSATALGLILREKGNPEQAEDAFRMALRLDPSDLSARLEAGDTFFEPGQWETALEWYEDVLAREPDHPWALPSALYCRWKLTDDQGHLDDVLALAKEGNGRAQSLWHRTFWAEPSEPVDATANVLRKIRERMLNDPEFSVDGGELRLTLSSLEAPSNFLAFNLEMKALGRDLRLLVAVNRVPVPDPREPITDVKYTLWRYDGIDASPALPPPPEDVVRRVAGLASMPFDEQAHWAKASRVAEALGPSRVGEVLAVMVHPPAVPKGTTALAWLPRVHRAAIDVAAQVDSGWEGSARREALFSVLLGPRDWPTEAAIQTLERLGRENEAFAPDIHSAFQQLADHRPDQGHHPWVVTLYRSWLELPHLFPREKEELQHTLRAIEEQESQEEEA